MEISPNRLRQTEEESFSENLQQMERDGTLTVGLRRLIEVEKAYHGTPEEGTYSHKEIKDRLTQIMDYMEGRGLTDDIKHTFSEVKLLEGDTIPEKDEIDNDWEFTNKWNENSRLEAIEGVLGRRITPEEVHTDPRLSIILRMSDAGEALLSLKLVKDQSDRDSADIAAIEGKE